MSSNRIHQADRYCVVCKKSFCRPNELRRHIKDTLKHNVNARQHRCYICKKGFTQKSNLPQHLKGVHKIGVIDEHPWGRKGKAPAKAKRGPRLARKNIRREASSFINYQWNPVVSALSPEGSPSVRAQAPSPALVPSPHPTSAFAPADTPYFGEISFPYNGFMDTSQSSPKYEEASMPLSFDYGSPGSSFSTPMTSPSTSSFGDARESAELEALVKFYFMTSDPHSVPPFQNTAFVNYPNGNGGVPHSSTPPPVYNVDGSFAPDKLEAYHGTETHSLVPLFNERLVGRLIGDVSRQRSYLQELYNREQQYPQLQYPQLPDYQQPFPKPQYGQQQQLDHSWVKAEDMLTDQCFLACGGIIQSPGVSQQQVQWLSLPDDISQLGNGAPY